MASIKFDNTEILDSTHIPRFIKHESATERFLNTLELARENGSVLVSDRRGRKIIRLQGILTATTEALLEKAIDTFKELFARQEKNLDISWEGTGTRRYVASCIEHSFDRDHFHQLFVPWVAEFVVLSGIGEDTTETTIVNADTFTTSYKTKVIALTGSAEPKIRFTIDVNSPNNYVRGIELKNTDNGERIIVISDYSLDNCIVEIDTRLKTAKIDGVITPYYGVFPHFVVGNNNIQITVGDIIDQQFVPIIYSSYAIYGSTKIAQSFRVPYTDSSYRSIYLMMSYIGSIVNYASIRIETDNNGKPSGTLVDANATSIIDTTDMTGGSTPTWYKRDFTNRFRLYANTDYWIVITNVGSGGDSSNCYKWNYDYGSRATYKLGNVSVYSGSSWSSKYDEDMVFKMLYGGINDTAWTQTYSIYQTKRYL